MKIKMLQSIAGHADPHHGLANFSFPPGCVVDVAEPLAKAWIASDIAIAAEKGDKLTMPAEVYTLRQKPAQPELEESAS